MIDKQLCGLVDRLRAVGYRHTLEVELRLMAIVDDSGECEFANFLPNFREKGNVTIVDTVYGYRILHFSKHSRSNRIE